MESTTKSTIFIILAVIATPLATTSVHQASIGDIKDDVTRLQDSVYENGKQISFIAGALDLSNRPDKIEYNNTTTSKIIPISDP